MDDRVTAELKQWDHDLLPPKTRPTTPTDFCHIDAAGGEGDCLFANAREGVRLRVVASDQPLAERPTAGCRHALVVSAMRLAPNPSARATTARRRVRGVGIRVNVQCTPPWRDATARVRRVGSAPTRRC